MLHIILSAKKNLFSYLQTLYQLSWMAWVAEREQTATTSVMLNTALPTTLPTPISSFTTQI